MYLMERSSASNSTIYSIVGGGGVPLGSSSGSACLVLGILLCLGCSVLCSPSGMQCSPELLQSGGVSVGLFGRVPAAPAVPYIN